MLSPEYFNRTVTEVTPLTFAVHGATEIVSQYLLAVPLQRVGHDNPARIVISHSGAKALVQDLEAAMMESDMQAEHDRIRAGIEAGDLDRNGDPVPYPMYRRA